MTSSQPRGLQPLIPTARQAATPGERGAAQLLHLRTSSVPVPVLVAAIELINTKLEDPDPVTRESATLILPHLNAAVEAAAPLSPGTAE
ncbi:hypothetical protein ACFZB9_23050 [Kitasatospora sp. NPDC008050]|uniref:hypothetical protein n=1 Tax=Kitasatospora sp. NPDC008050 TaxID=3364021 RepID=UPI0036E808CE